VTLPGCVQQQKHAQVRLILCIMLDFSVFKGFISDNIGDFFLPFLFWSKVVKNPSLRNYYIYMMDSTVLIQGS
jgi:hypothetical protein